MAKHYKLVTCFKNKYSFLNEQELDELFDQPITNLEEIDCVTCRYPDSAYLLNLLDKDGIISGKNHLSIRYKKSGENYYLNPIFGIPELTSVIDDLEEFKSFQDGHPITYKIVNHKNSFFKEKFQEFFQLLGDEPEYFFEEVYGKNKPKVLKHLVNLYFSIKKQNSDSLEDEYALRDLFNKIELEFSRYKNFRGYLVYTEKYKKNNPNFVSDISFSNIDRFTNDDSNVYNDDEKEEFLTEQEIIDAVSEGDDWLHAPRKR